MTITEKILAAHCGADSVRPGQFVECAADFCMGNDVTAPLAIKAFESVGAAGPFDRERIALVPSHFVPNKDIQSAEQCKMMREWAIKHRIKWYFERGEAGVDHALLPEQGLVGPGDLVIGADSHTCTYGALGAFSTGVGSTDLAAVMATGRIWLRVPESMKFVYKGLPSDPWVGGKDLVLLAIKRVGFDGATYKAMEFTGEAISRLPMDGRLTMCNMAIEAGGKSGIIAPDAVTEEYCRGRCRRPYVFYASDPDANYRDENVFELDISGLSPLVAMPHSPDNVASVDEVGDVRIDQVFLGSCTNGRLSDMRIAASILKGRRVAKGVRFVVIPATPTIFLDALRAGYIEILKEAGADIGDSHCGPCLGGHYGVLAAGEVCLATSNRNFPGRMGHRDSKVYLCSPAVAAASAAAGKIVSPAKLGIRP